MKIICFSILMAFITGCDKIPADPNKSFEKAQVNGLFVGYSSNNFWVIGNNQEPGGVEPLLIKEFARQNGMRVIWINGSEQELLRKLEKKDLHIVIAGFTDNNPWKKKKIGITKPYFKQKKEKHIIAIQQGENKLLVHLEKYLFTNREEIKKMVYANYQEL